MDTKKITRRRAEPMDSTDYTEICIAVIGSVDSGKSTTIGTLVSDTLDDGNGLARSSVFLHPHERESGRTSDISYQHMKIEDSKRIITFVDLAGHEAYLKTTLTGLSSAAPDFAIVCISDKITKMTKEHIGLCYAMKIPFVVLFTKCDIVPKNVATEVTESTRKLIISQNSKFYQFKNKDDFKLIENQQSLKIIPYITVSNKTGDGLDLLRHAICLYKPRCRFLPAGFVVEHIYNVPGHGIVLSGIAGQSITTGDSLQIGPFSSGEFWPINVRSIHNDYRYEIKELTAGKKGCIAVTFKSGSKNISKANTKQHKLLKKGLLISKSGSAQICKEFTARVFVVHHSVTIKPGYTAFVNCGMLREAVTFIEIYDKTGDEVQTAKTMSEVIIKMRFKRGYNYVPIGQTLVFREGTVRGFGIVIETADYSKVNK